MAVAVEEAQISRPEPAVRETTCSSWVVIEVSGRDNRTAADDLTGFTRSQELSGLVHDRDLGAPGDAKRSNLACAGVEGGVGELRCLGKSVVLCHENVEHPLQLFHDRPG